MTFKRLFQLCAMCFIALTITSSVELLGGQKPDSQSSKVYSIVLNTIEKMKADGITPRNARVMNVQKKYSTLLTQFDAEGRFGLILDVKQVSPSLLTQLRDLGGDVMMVLPYSRLVSVFMPIDQIEAVAHFDDVLIVRPMTGGVTNAGSKTSEGDSIHHAIHVRTDLNVKGDSIKVGIISDGCVHWQAARDSGDLPSDFDSTNFSFVNGNKIGSGDEGTAMMEIVHDIAPNAKLYFYGALGMGGGSPTMVDAIQRLVREKGCDIIVDDLTYFDQPMFEDASPATAWTIAAAAKWANDTGVVYVSSAGNFADGPPNFIDRSHYQAMYSDINPGSNVVELKPLPNGPIVPGAPPNWDDLHFFGVDPDPNPAGAIGLKVIMPAWTGFPNPKPKLYVMLEWNDPWGASADDYDLYIYDKNFVMRRAFSVGIQVGAQNPYEAVADSNYEYWDDTVNIVINHRDYPPLEPPKLLGMYIWGAKWVEYFTPQNSIWGQPGVPEVIAVGAVPYNNINNIESYSSRGNYDVYFPLYQSRQKPDVVATDGVSITGAGGFGFLGRFYGTSASAPHVAGMAALLLSKCPTMTPAQVHAKFERTAIDLGAAGFDQIYGNGRMDIERAMLEVNTVVAASGPYQMNNSVNVPMFFATADGYAVDNVTVTGGANQPNQVNSTVTVTAGSPYVSAGVIDPGCPTINRWYQLTKNGGANGQFNATVTSYIDESERSASGIASTDLRLIHWNGSYFEILPQAVAPVRVRDTWKVKTTYNNASFSPFFVGYLTRGIDVATVSSATGNQDSTVTVSFSLHNTGNGWDTLSFHCTDTRGWAVAPADSAISLTANQQVNIDIRVTISSSDSVGTIDTVWLVSKSVSDAAYTDSSSATVTIVPLVITLTCHVDDSWNLVSLPVTRDDRRETSVYPTAVSQAFAYQGEYVVKETLDYGSGYWMKFNGAQDVGIEGIPRKQDSVAVSAKWNIVGGISYVVDVDSIVEVPGGIVTSQYFGYNGGYQVADSIEPGKAYWVKTSNAGKLFMKKPGALAQPKQYAKDHNALHDLNALTISDVRGRTTTLYFGKQSFVESMLSKSELPPLPPSGVLDARFESGRFVERYSTGSRSTRLTIDLQADAYPLTLRWNVVEEGVRFSFADDADPMLSLEKDNGALLIHQLTKHLSIIVHPLASAGVPREFALEQNYPNPFNPSTEIRFQISDFSHVSLKVFDILGREVATLVNEVKEPGEYTVTWDARQKEGGQASNVPSGVYFYRLVAGKFSEVKKMLLAK